MHPCKTDELKFQAKTACNLLINPNDTFGICLDLIEDDKIYYSECLWDYCKAALIPKENTSLALCSSFEAMSRECSGNYLNLNWRTEDRCCEYK